MSEDITQLKEEEKKLAGEADKASRESCGAGNNNWIGGVVLVAIGLIFLFANLGAFELNNWWALFILIPAISNFGSAWNNFRQHGRLTKSGRGSITGGLILSLIAFTFIFEWSWSVIWPVFLIIGGIGALLGGWFD
jgi:hypothetical protein